MPLVDLSFQAAAVAGEVDAGFASVIGRGAFVLGPEVGAFEAEFARYCGTGHCVAVGNGTDALEIALRAAGVGAGAEVVVPVNSFVATAEAVVRCGALPVFVDCDPSYYLMDPEDLAARVGPRTRAVIPVHLYGQVAPMERIRDALGGAEVAVVEDAAQAQGAQRHGRRAGGLGDVAATSFYPGKNLGAYGDAGGIMTDSPAVARLARKLRNHGGEERYEHSAIGLNSRMDTLQAVVLLAKLARLDEWNGQRRAAADRYTELLADLDEVKLPTVLAGGTPVWHLYVVQVPRRDEVLASLHDDGIGAGVHYPSPIHLLAPWSGFVDRAQGFPVAEAAAGRLLSLPIYPGITEALQEQVAEALRRALRR